MTLVSVLPDGAPAPSPALGDESTNVRNAISSDGSRVFFSTEEGEEGEAPGLYMRDTKKGETLKISAAQGVVEPTGEESEVDFQAASSDGSRVFFTDTAPLTPESTQRQAREADLYECEIIETDGKLACDLKDLTPLASGGSADVLNVIPGISENGSYVYFVANGVLAPGAKPGQCVHEAQEVAPAGATCNLYVWHEGTITFIAALSNEDSGRLGQPARLRTRRRLRREPPRSHRRDLACLARRRIPRVHVRSAARPAMTTSTPTTKACATRRSTCIRPARTC